MDTAENPQKVELKESPWENSTVANLVRWKSSKIYFARFKVGGRLVRKSLDTPLLSVARNRLEDLIKQEREREKGPTRILSNDPDSRQLPDFQKSLAT
ncbi:MAG TPA: hypothetical protein VL981_03995 [Candidatus Methylacidiphilales bacterium]|nr:hypothetical protein [Candidatus Methylacidiphilales bacterium]